MASLRIEEPETALGHVRRMMDNVTIMKEQTAALLQQVEAVGNEISPGLQGFVPKLKEIIPLMNDTVESVEEAQRALCDLIEKDNQINSIEHANLKSNAVNQINTETIENVIMLIKIWQDQVVEAETVITTAVNYLTDENNIDGDTTEILKKDVEQVSKNIATVKA